MSKYLIIKDVITDSLIFRAPKVIISYVKYIPKYMRVFMCIDSKIKKIQS